MILTFCSTSLSRNFKITYRLGISVFTAFPSDVSEVTASLPGQWMLETGANGIHPCPMLQAEVIRGLQMQ